MLATNSLIPKLAADTRGLTQTATECFRIKLQGDLSAEGHDIHLSDGSAPIDVFVSLQEGHPLPEFKNFRKVA